MCVCLRAGGQASCDLLPCALISLIADRPSSGAYARSSVRALGIEALRCPRNTLSTPLL